MAIDIRSEYITNVRDPIWNDIGLTSCESQIINTESFSRLRHIRQMGFAYLAFQGANHSRYEHSIGVLRAAHLMYQMIKEIPTEVVGDSIEFLRLAALLHDIGHPPFSHAVEEAFIKYPNLLDFGNEKGRNISKLKNILGNPPSYSHEKFAIHIIKTNPEISNILSNTNYNIEGIANLATGSSDQAFNLFLNGDFDVDKIDYIIRDSYYCGLSHQIDLNEFRGKIVMEKDENTQRYKLYLTPEGVSAVNSLLLARYKLIRVAHDNEKNRIATQMVIEKIRLWLEDMSPDIRAKTIIDIHTHMTDYGLVNHLTQYKKGPDINNILNGKLYHQILKIPFSFMHPSVRASTHIVLNNPIYISKLQRQFRKDFNDQTLLFDISEPKPPKFTTLVQFEDTTKGTSNPRNIFSRYYTAHGILIDSFNDLSVYIYSNSPVDMKNVNLVKEKKGTKTILSENGYVEKLDPDMSIVANRIIQSAREIRKLKSENRIVLDIDLLMVVLFTVEKYGKEKLDQRELWVYTDTSLHNYLQKVVDFCKTKGLKIESQFIWDNQGFSTKIFRDLERLINMGLVDHIHKLVPHGPEWSFRIDRRISGWGKTYVGKELSNLHKDVRNYVLDTLKNNHSSLKMIIDTERLIEQIDDLSIISKRGPLNDKLKSLGAPLRERKDLILTIG